MRRYHPTFIILPRLGALTIVVALAVAAVAVLLPEAAAEAWWFAAVLLAGLATGALGLLMIGHLMSEDWLAPVRRDAEAVALAAPLVAIFFAPLAFRLGALYPWASSEISGLPGPRAAYLDPGLFLLRAVAYLAIWIALAVWMPRAANKRIASGVGLALLAPTVTLAANDWVLSREPFWWSSLFGFGFAVSQLLGAFALVVALVLARRPPERERMVGLERALLTLALLVLWTWFAQFLIVWLANLPEEAAWYLLRSDEWLWPLAYVALPALAIAVVILAPPGVGRWTMLTGALLLLVQHLAHMAWLLLPSGRGLAPGPGDPAVLAGLGLVWAIWVALVRRVLPDYAAQVRDRNSAEAALVEAHPRAG